MLCDVFIWVGFGFMSPWQSKISNSKEGFDAICRGWVVKGCTSIEKAVVDSASDMYVATIQYDGDCDFLFV